MGGYLARINTEEEWNQIKKQIKEEGKSAEEIKARWKDDVEKFKVQRKPYLLYEE